MKNYGSLKSFDYIYIYIYIYIYRLYGIQRNTDAKTLSKKKKKKKTTDAKKNQKIQETQ